jgi:glycerol-3-phosphate dehydrogenase
VLVRDEIGATDVAVRARFTVNATGPWLDRTIARVRREGKPLLRLTKGIHLVTPAATRQAHVLFAKSDGRLFFVLPWRGETIVGTTDTDYQGDPADAAATEDDVRYLQSEAKRAFPNAPFDQILFTWAGVRALVKEEGVREGEVSRKHALFDHQQREGLAGLLSVVGGKITAYRDIAEEVTDVVAQKLGRRTASATAEALLPGARGSADVDEAVDPDTRSYLQSVYGSRASAVVDLVTDASLAAPLCPHHRGIAAEVVHAVRGEWAMTLGDILLRRTAIGLNACQGLDCIDAVADRVAGLLNWDDARRKSEIAAYRTEIEPMRRFSAP